MAPDTIVVVDASAEHFAAIAEIERTSGRTSAVTLTGGRSLQESLDRGHWLATAIEGNLVIGWIWFTIELDRGGEYTGIIQRIGVASPSRRAGAGRALIEYARNVFLDRAVSRVRVTVESDNADAISFFSAAGFAADTVTLEKRL